MMWRLLLVKFFHHLPLGIFPADQMESRRLLTTLMPSEAAESMGTGMVLSMYSGSSLEEIADCAPSGLRWLHMDLLSNTDVMKYIINRAENKGYTGIFVTLDRPVASKKRAPNIVTKAYGRFPVSFGHFQGTDTPYKSSDKYTEHSDGINTWETIDWLQSITRLPIVAKGILTAEDAREAVKHGVSGILVSNHGGRQLDGVMATIDVLPEVAQAVKGTGVEIYLDGGVRLGTDVLKALALGAKAVFVGRPILWGLALDGECGVKRVLKILQEEFDIAMALTGCRSVEEINADLVQKGCTCVAKL
ncbi:2-Hydroxyacid oxidase 1-like isoform X2 [Amphiura filiformis]|uniref:2-Hydroxyacid oxidase 1-like isoform X2 n=1 Tax=Amphiura filiformis TaxID=82378 RepID=UPI003B21BF85